MGPVVASMMVVMRLGASPALQPTAMANRQLHLSLALVRPKGEDASISSTSAVSATMDSVPQMALIHFKLSKLAALNMGVTLC